MPYKEIEDIVKFVKQYYEKNGKEEKSIADFGR